MNTLTDTSDLSSLSQPRELGKISINRSKLEWRDLLVVVYVAQEFQDFQEPTTAGWRTFYRDQQFIATQRNNLSVALF